MIPYTILVEIFWSELIVGGEDYGIHMCIQI